MHSLSQPCPLRQHLLRPSGAARGLASAEAAGGAWELRRCGPPVEQPPPRSSPTGSYSEMSLRAAAGPSPSPPRPTLATSFPRPPQARPRRDPPAAGGPDPPRCVPPPQGEKQSRRKRAATRRLGSLGSCFVFNTGAVFTQERGSRLGIQPGITSLSGIPGHRPHLQQSCAGESGVKDEFRLDPPLLGC